MGALQSLASFLSRFWNRVAIAMNLPITEAAIASVYVEMENQSRKCTKISAHPAAPRLSERMITLVVKGLEDLFLRISRESSMDKISKKPYSKRKRIRRESHSHMEKISKKPYGNTLQMDSYTRRYLFFPNFGFIKIPKRQFCTLPVAFVPKEQEFNDFFFQFTSKERYERIWEYVRMNISGAISCSVIELYLILKFLPRFVEQNENERHEHEALKSKLIQIQMNHYEEKKKFYDRLENKGEDLLEFDRDFRNFLHTRKFYYSCMQLDSFFLAQDYKTRMAILEVEIEKNIPKILADFYLFKKKYKFIPKFPRIGKYYKKKNSVKNIIVTKNGPNSNSVQDIIVAEWEISIINYPMLNAMTHLKGNEEIHLILDENPMCEDFYLIGFPVFSVLVFRLLRKLNRGQGLSGDIHPDSNEENTTILKLPKMIFFEKIPEFENNPKELTFYKQFLDANCIYTSFCENFSSSFAFDREFLTYLERKVYVTIDENFCLFCQEDQNKVFSQEIGKMFFHLNMFIKLLLNRLHEDYTHKISEYAKTYPEMFDFVGFNYLFKLFLNQEAILFVIGNDDAINQKGFCNFLQSAFLSWNSICLQLDNGSLARDQFFTYVKKTKTYFFTSRVIFRQEKGISVPYENISASSCSPRNVPKFLFHPKIDSIIFALSPSEHNTGKLLSEKEKEEINQIKKDCALNINKLQRLRSQKIATLDKVTANGIHALLVMQMFKKNIEVNLKGPSDK
jgi:hypothetical protein